MNAPCKDCNHRQLNCHSNCKKYDKFKFVQAFINNQNKKHGLNNIGNNNTYVGGQKYHTNGDKIRLRCM